MHHEITKRLFDAFPPDRKGDFWAGYLYLKYTEHFFNYSLEASGLEPRKDLPPLDEGLEEMLRAINWQIGQGALSTETSLFLGDQLQSVLQLHHLAVIEAGIGTHGALSDLPVHGLKHLFDALIQSGKVLPGLETTCCEGIVEEVLGVLQIQVAGPEIAFAIQRKRIEQALG